MSLIVTIPAARSTPLRWAAQIVFERMLGLSVEITECSNLDHVVISADGRSLLMRSLFPNLHLETSCWREQMPALPLLQWDVVEVRQRDEFAPPLPVLFGHPLIKDAGNGLECGVDILGTIFFAMSRFEEIVIPDRDHHERFPATASLAWKGGFLYRPIVDEYVDVLWALMRRQWPGLARKWRQGSVTVSCDVDYPFDPSGKGLGALARAIASDIREKADIALVLRRLGNFVLHRRGDFSLDMNFTFDWYMDTCERYGHRVEFYFIADHSAGAIDGNYEITDQPVLELIRNIASRGHEIGMHGSYNTFRDLTQIMREKNRLQAACDGVQAGIQLRGNRQHYLRWAADETPDFLDAAGFQYDSTGCFADRPGFRFGTSHPFPMWSWKQRAPLKIMQHPLVMMEASLLSRNYLALDFGQAREMIKSLKRTALLRGGDFSILWHNSELASIAERDLFEEAIQ